MNNTFPSTSPGSSRPWRLQQAFPNGGVGGLVFDEPMGFVPVPNSPSLYVWGKNGDIWLLKDGFEEETKQVALDIRSKTVKNSEHGLQSIALHPEFGQTDSPNRGHVYAIYTTGLGGSSPNASYQARWRLVRFTVADPESSLVIDPASELILVEQYTRSIHHGGALFFGPLDRFLYFSVGDGDMISNSQQIDQRLFSGVFRIDVDSDPSRSHPIPKQPVHGSTAHYYIPNDNPFVDEPDALGEFFALGLRNPFRVTADKETGAIFAGDVGGNLFEEVNQIIPGGNYQWGYREGFQVRSAPPSPLVGTEQPPIHVLGRDLANAVIGGFTYRGSTYADELGGRYLFADHGSGMIYALEDPQGGNTNRVALAEMPPPPPTNLRGASVSGFSQDSEGELYVVQLDPNGKIFKLVKNDEEGPVFPALLSETGAFTDTANMEPAPFLVPYEVNSPLWSDGALKKRWIVMPNDGPPYQSTVEQAVWTQKYEWFFPFGTVFIKHFELPVNEGDPAVLRRLETRFLVIDGEGKAYGLTYRWRPDGSDADLVDVDGSEEEIDVITLGGQIRQQTWTYPSQNQCMQCHTPQSRYVLGANNRQLNRMVYYEGATEPQNQLIAWSNAGLIQTLTMTDLEMIPFLADLDDATTQEHRARSYLDVNCSHCHQPGGVRALFDARYDTPLVAQGFINGRSAEVSGDTLLVPGDPESSFMFHRLGLLGPGQMPPIAKNVVHEAAVALLNDYIHSVSMEDFLPDGWKQTNLGVTFQEGLARYSDGVFELGSAGFIRPGRDNVLFVHRAVVGDFELIAKVGHPRIRGNNNIVLAGLMARNSLAAGSPMYGLINTGDVRPGVRVWGREIENSTSGLAVTATNSSHQYLRLTRNGDTLRSYHSHNGTNWILANVASEYLDSGALEIGLFFGGHTDIVEELNSVTFDQVSFDATTVGVTALNVLAVLDSSDGEFSFARSGPLDDALVLDLVWSGEAAGSSNGLDLPTTIMFGSGESSVSFTVAVPIDMVNSAEKLTVTISSNDRFLLSDPSATIGMGSTAFDAWRALHFSPIELADPTVSGFHGNPDGDSYSNLLEYFLGTDPNLPSDGVITAWIEAGFFHLRYPRSLHVPDANGSVTAATTLVDPLWSGATVSEVGSEIIGFQEWHTVRDLRPIANEDTIFLRLEVGLEDP